jgi:hypothetical protein
VATEYLDSISGDHSSQPSGTPNRKPDPVTHVCTGREKRNVSNLGAGLLSLTRCATARVIGPKKTPKSSGIQRSSHAIEIVHHPKAIQNTKPSLKQKAKNRL